jgi:hypothetical protein
VDRGSVELLQRACDLVRGGWSQRTDARSAKGEEKSSTYGSLGMAATLLLGFFLIGRVIVGAAVLNATLHDRHRRTHDDKASTPSPKPSPRRAAEPTDRHKLR